MAAMSFTTLTPLMRASPPPHLHLHLHLQPKTTSFSIQTMRRRRKRGEMLVSNAGPPSSTSLILAFILPLSLLAGTVFASIRIADDLDDKFLQDLAVNKALMEENDDDDYEEEEEEDGEFGVDIDGSGSRVMEVEGEEEVAVPAAAPRIRNRPRREG